MEKKIIDKVAACKALQGKSIADILSLPEFEENLEKTTDEEIKESLDAELLDGITEEEILSEEERICPDMLEKNGVEDEKVIKNYKRFDQRV